MTPLLHPPKGLPSLFTRYVRAKLIKATLWSTFAFVVFVSCLHLLRLLDWITVSSIPIKGLFTLVGLLAPDTFAGCFPLGFFIGTTWTYYHLIRSRELEVAYAMGCDFLQLLYPVHQVGSWAITPMLAMTLAAVPYSFHTLRQYEQNLRQAALISLFRPGHLIHRGNTVIFAQHRLDGSTLQGVFFSDAHDNQHKIITAQKATLHPGQVYPQVVLQLHHGTQYTQTANKPPFFVTFDRYDIEIAPPSKDTERPIKPYERSFQELYSPPQGLSKSERLLWRQEADLRMLIPFFPWILGMLAARLLLSTFQFPRYKTLYIVMVASLGSLLFYIGIQYCLGFSLTRYAVYLMAWGGWVSFTIQAIYRRFNSYFKL